MTGRLDPLETAKQIEGSYKRYLKTLLAPRDEQLAAAFDEEIDASTLLSKGPILEMTPPYETGATCRQLIDEGVLHQAFSKVDSQVLGLDRPLYVHQETAVRKFTAGRNLVVSTGTGSGKTESFLIPIINALVEESAKGTLGPGVRALLLYPMNALANDQLKRLRAVLASVPEITFGRYTGETAEDARSAEADFLQTNPGEKRLPNELLSRQEMRENPPHLLLTNYAMLEYLLLRPADIDLFDGPHAGTWRFIVMDEAHVYDGAQGSEVALLIRRLKQRVAPGANLQCIATSASLNGSVRNDPHGEAMEFASNLFDATFEYVDADVNRQDLVEPVRKKHALTPTWRLTGDQLLGLRSGALKLIDVVPAAVAVAEALAAERSMADLKDALSGGPVDVRTLRERLWPDDDQSAEKLDALVELGSGTHDDSGHPVLSARYHLFVRATEGAFVSFADNGPHIFLGRHEVDPATGRAVFEFGTCTRCGAVHLAGDVERRDAKEYFVPSKKADSSVNWLVLADEQGDVVVDEDEVTLAGDEVKAAKSDPTARRLCTCCGLLADAAATTCPSGQCGGQMLLVREHPRATRVMSRCTECGTQSRQGVRRLRTDVNAAPAVVTTALYQQLPEAADESADQVGGGRKLLMFSDSRQAAAFAAPYLDRTYTRMLERRYITQALRDPMAKGDLTVADLALLTREKADAAGHFPRQMGKIEITQAINQWVSGELMTLETRQSLEGLGLLKIELRRDAPIALRGFTSLGLTEDEAWSLLNELVKTVRLQGAVTVLDRVDVKDERFAPRNTRVRMRSTGSDSKKQIISWSPSGTGTTNGRMIFLRKVLEKLGNDIPAEKILEGCWKALDSSGFFASESERGGGGFVFQIDHTKLSVSNGVDCRWYRCGTCRLMTAFSVREVCPNSRCTGRLEPFELPAPETDSNHYRVVYQTMNTAPLTAREHTAQWRAKEAAEIQREFINGAVNVLSCSTTFELGVDVGDLQSVVMRNMPPKTANYVQRAGRAGRRAASAALVVTYANRSAHDLAQYQDPTSMIAGKMRIPWVPVDNARIARRHAHSIALAAYFRHCFENHDEKWTTAGQFFSPEGAGSSPASVVRDYLTPVPPAVTDALRTALPQGVQIEIGVDDGTWVTRLVELLESVEEELVEDVSDIEERIQESVKERKYGLSKRLEETKRTIVGRNLLGYLGSRNILPKYGFPVDTVELSTVGAADPIGGRLELGRDLSLAIYDYAPGNQVVAGGRVWTSAGLKKRPGKELVRHRFRICGTCGRFERGGDLDPNVVCPSCLEPFRSAGTLIIPEFGFIAASDTQDVGSAPPERRWHGGSYIETHGEEAGLYQWAGPSGLKVAARAGVRAWLSVVSDGVGDGFQLCEWCGWAAASERGVRRKKHQRPENGRDCDGPLEKISLGHRYQSDIAEFTFDGVPYQRDHEANWLSALYAILEGASQALEITRDDIDGALSWSADHRRSIVLFDTVPGGAGSAKRIAENIGVVLGSAQKRVSECDCGEETSCYGCLRSYRNGRFHEDLSRAAALRILGRVTSS